MLGGKRYENMPTIVKQCFFPHSFVLCLAPAEYNETFRCIDKAFKGFLETYATRTRMSTCSTTPLSVQSSDTSGSGRSMGIIRLYDQRLFLWPRTFLIDLLDDGVHLLALSLSDHDIISMWDRHLHHLLERSLFLLSCSACNLFSSLATYCTYVVRSSKFITQDRS
jgi:hypothetical protein